MGSLHTSWWTVLTLPPVWWQGASSSAECSPRPLQAALCASPGHPPSEGPAEAPALRGGSEGAKLPAGASGAGGRWGEGLHPGAEFRCIRGRWGREGLHLGAEAGAATRRGCQVNSRVSITSFHHGLWKVRNLQPGTCYFQRHFTYLPFWTVVDPRRSQLQVRGGDVGNTARRGAAQGVLGEGVRPAQPRGDQDKLGGRLTPGAQVTG